MRPAPEQNAARRRRRPTFCMIVGAVAAACLPAACSFGEGQGFATLSTTLRSRFAGFAPDTGRVQQDGWYKTDNSFELQFQRLQLLLRSVTLLGGADGGLTAAGGDDCAFDPANPPAGCTLCHGGHCHCGAELKDYDELEAEVCGGSSVRIQAPVAQFQVTATQDLLGEGSEGVLSDCSVSGDRRLSQQRGPACELGEGEIVRVQLAIARLRIGARLRDSSRLDRLQGVQPTIAVDWDLAGATLAVDLERVETFDKDSPDRVDLTLELPVSERLLDGIAWELLDRDGDTVRVDAQNNQATGEALTASLASTAPQATVARSGDADRWEDL